MSPIVRKSIDLVNQVGGVTPSPEAVFDAVHAVMHLYRSQQHQSVRGSSDELTHMDSKVLSFFARHPGATQKDLAEHSGRDKGQLARLISGLKDRGLLEGHADETDRRNIRLQLTVEGRSAQLALHRRARKLSVQALANLSAEEQRQLIGLLSRVGCNLQGQP